MGRSLRDPLATPPGRHGATEAQRGVDTSLRPGSHCQTGLEAWSLASQDRPLGPSQGDLETRDLGLCLFAFGCPSGASFGPIKEHWKRSQET